MLGPRVRRSPLLRTLYLATQEAPIHCSPRPKSGPQKNGQEVLPRYHASWHLFHSLQSPLEGSVTQSKTPSLNIHFPTRRLERPKKTNQPKCSPSCALPSLTYQGEGNSSACICLLPSSRNLLPFMKPTLCSVTQFLHESQVCRCRSEVPGNSE